MKKVIYSIPVLMLLIFSCQKEKDLQYEAGETKGMLITNYNTSIKADHLTGNRSVTLDLDLNSDGAIDIQFTSFQDSIQPVPYPCSEFTEEEQAAIEFEGEKFFYASTEIRVPQGIFSFPIQENSNFSYLITSDPYIIDRPGGATFMTETTFTKTKHSINTESSSDNNSTILTVKKDELISTNQPFTGKECYLDMRNSSYELAMFYKDEEGLRQGKIKRKERNCFEVPANEIRYIIFKSAMQWGWISFEITEENRITIIEVALSKK